MNQAEFFDQHPVFTHAEFTAWKKAINSSIKAISINTALRHYIKKGRIINIKRQLYAVVPISQAPESFNVDPFLIAAKSSPDSILAYHTAIELHGVAYTSFSQYTYLTEKKNKPLDFQYHYFQPTAHPVSLLEKNKTQIEVETINRQGVEIKLTSLARTYVDALDRIELCGGWEEVIRALENMAVINIDQVVRYCLLLNNAALVAKVGYFLEKRVDAFKVDNKDIKKLYAKKPANPVYASKPGRDKFVLVKKWNLLLPEAVINKQWDEPDVDV